jgi:hypothetical protein
MIIFQITYPTYPTYFDFKILKKNQIFDLVFWGHFWEKIHAVKLRVEARVTIQEIKSLGVLKTETCH